MAYVSGYQGLVNPAAVATIASSAQESSAIACGGMALVGIYLPAAFTGTALTFEACTTVGGTYQPVFNSAGAVSYTVAQGNYYAIDPKDFQGIQFLKIKSGTAEGAARTLNCVLKG